MKLYQEGPRSARIMLVGESPGRQEVASGRPFVGGSGQLLNTALGRVGIDRATCFVTNICHVQPPDNDFAWFEKPANQAHLVMGLLRLKADIEEIKPTLIIALGAKPLRYLTNKIGIDKWRGSVLPCTLVPGVKVIATYHPAYILRSYDYKGVMEFDLRRAASQATFPEINYPVRELILNPSPARANAIGSEMYNAEWLAIDIECWQNDSGGWDLACVGFSDRHNRAMVLPYDSAFNRTLIKTLCESPVKKVLQNGTFDATVLASHSVAVTNFAWDTMIAHHALFPECATSGDEMTMLAGKKRQAAIGKGLKFLASLYTLEPYYKDDGKVWRESGDIEMFWRYNALDAAVTREIRDAQDQELRAFGTMPTFQHAMSLVTPLMLATNRGIKIDLAERSRLIGHYTHEIDNLQTALDTLAGGPVNVKSAPQVQALLYDKLRLPVQRKRGEDRITTDKDAINALANRFSNPELHTILEIRERRDLLERYLQAPIDSDGRMRCSFDITGTRSGRLSSRQSIHGSGTNLQTIPEELRSFFVADEGKVFVYRDYSQAEARVVAYLARCQGLIDLFNDPTRDIHKENAARIFNIDVSQVNSVQRYLAKRVVHASNYGMEAKRLVEIINNDYRFTGIRISEAEAQHLLDKYFYIYPEIKDVFWKDVVTEIRYSRTLTNAFGRKRTFYGRYDDKLLRDAYSWKPQSTVGDLGTMALVRIHDAIPECQVLLNVHDSILVQCDEADVDYVADAMGRAMEIPITIFADTFLIPTDCKVGRNWGNRGKDGTNPNGLHNYEGTWTPQH